LKSNKSTAIILLNRNLKNVVEKMYEHFSHHDSDEADIFIVESGSEESNLPKHPNWWANWPDAMENGLRFPRGFNYGLMQLQKESIYKDYEFIFLVCNDIEFAAKPTIRPLVEEIRRHPRLGILSPLSLEWGEAALIPQDSTKYFWNIVPNAWLVRRALLDVIRPKEPTINNFFFDGENFRGFGTETECIAKAYINDWAAGITSCVKMNENKGLLVDRSQLIKTNPFEESLALALEEGLSWMHRKYGFPSRWSMQMYTKFFYDKFFTFFPETEKYRV
jgi:hypothetical protein